jgi:hypothetical protein
MKDTKLMRIWMKCCKHVINDINCHGTNYSVCLYVDHQVWDTNLDLFEKDASILRHTLIGKYWLLLYYSLWVILQIYFKYKPCDNHSRETTDFNRRKGLNNDNLYLCFMIRMVNLLMNCTTPLFDGWVWVKP